MLETKSRVSSDKKFLDVSNIFNHTLIDDSVFMNNTIKIVNEDKFNLLIQNIKTHIKKTDSLDEKFTNPIFYDPKNCQKIVKITVIHNELKSYFNFNKKDLKMFRLILSLKIHLYNKLKIIINFQFTSKSVPKSLPSHPIIEG